MFKLNCFFITVTISFLSLFLFQTETSIPFVSATAKHEIKIEGQQNTSAISINNAFLKIVGFEKQELPGTHFISAFKYLIKRLPENHASYLKACDSIALNLTVRIIIYPFHSFL